MRLFSVTLRLLRAAACDQQPRWLIHLSIIPCGYPHVAVSWRAVGGQARALAITSLVSLAVGGAGLMALRQTLQPRDVTEVATFADALAVVRQQRVPTCLCTRLRALCRQLLDL